MSTRFIRKRHRRVLPIGQARLRESHLANGIPKRHRCRHYPLYESCNEIYNCKNLHECLQSWDEYSENMVSNMKKAAEVLQIMANHDESTPRDIQEATRILCENVFPYLDNPSNYENLFMKLQGDKLTESKQTIKDTLYQIRECDRLNANYKMINEQFNLSKYFRTVLKSYPLKEALYYMCEGLEYLNMDMASKYCLALENALYSLDRLVDEIPAQLVVEGVTDYYLEHYGSSNVKEFCNIIEQCVDQDEFLPTETLAYVDFIDKVNEEWGMFENDEEDEDGKTYTLLHNNKELLQKTHSHFEENVNLQMIDDYNDLMKSNYYSLQEFEILDKAKEIYTKFKAIPDKSINMAKEAIRKVLVVNRLQDIQKSTHNALAIAFYACITLGLAVSFGPIAGLLGLISSYTLHQNISTVYLKNSIIEWKEHRYSVMQKMKTASGSDRAKLETYLAQVDRNISLLEDEYEKKRDATAGELSGSIDAKTRSYDYDPESADVNPLGENPLASPKPPQKIEEKKEEVPNNG